MKHDYNNTFTVNTVTTHHIGFVSVHEYSGRVEIEKVVVEQEGNADAEWNVLLGGSTIFSSTQSVAAADTPETFIPGDPSRYATGSNLRAELDVTSSAGAADQLHVDLLIDDDA